MMDEQRKQAIARLRARGVCRELFDEIWRMAVSVHEPELQTARLHRRNIALLDAYIPLMDDPSVIARAGRTQANLREQLAVRKAR